MTCVRVMMIGTTPEQLAQLSRSLGDVLIAPSAGPDHGGVPPPGARLIQFGRVPVDGNLALHLYLIAGQQRFAFMWSVLGRDMMGCLVLADLGSPESVANARECLRAVRASGVPAVAVGVNDAAGRAGELAQELGIMPPLRVVPCDSGNRDSVKQALCAVLRDMPAYPEASRPEAAASPTPGAHPASVPAGVT